MPESQNKISSTTFCNNIIRFDTVDSTNNELQRLAENGAPHGTVVLAEEQKKGKGRGGRNWHSPQGKGLWFSVLLRPQNVLPERIASFTAVTATAIVEAINENTGQQAKVKWPNDIFINGRKTAGILAELKTKGNVINYLIIGIGINVNQKIKDFPEEITATATSLFLEKGSETDRGIIFFSLLNKLESSYFHFIEKGFTPFRKLWMCNNITLGKSVSIRFADKTIDGIALDIDNEAALIVEDLQKVKHRVNFGEII